MLELDPDEMNADPQNPEFWIRIADPHPDPENQFKTESRGSGPILQYCNSSFAITLKGWFFYLFFFFCFQASFLL